MNLEGEVIGINTWIAQGQNLGFAVDVRHLIALREKKMADKTISLTNLTAPEESIEGLLADFITEYKYLLAAAGQSWTQAGARKLVESKHPALTFLPKAMDLAERHRAIPAGYRAVEAGCYMASLRDCPKPCNALFKPIAARILEEYMDRPGTPKLLYSSAGRNLARCESSCGRPRKREKRPSQGASLARPGLLVAG